MEATLLGKALTGVLLAAAISYLLFLRPWRLRTLWSRRVPAIDLLFLVALATGGAAVHWQTPFERIAWVLVDQTDLPGTLEAVDTRIREVEALPEQIWKDLTSRLGWTNEPATPVPAPDGPGIVTTAVLPALVTVVEVLVRAFVYWGSLIALAVCLVMRLAVGFKRSVVAAVPTWRQDPLLEGRISELEEIVLTLRHLPRLAEPEL